MGRISSWSNLCMSTLMITFTLCKHSQNGTLELAITSSRACYFGKALTLGLFHTGWGPSSRASTWCAWGKLKSFVGVELSLKSLEIVCLREKLPVGDPVQKACLNAPTEWQQATEPFLALSNILLSAWECDPHFMSELQQSKSKWPNKKKHSKAHAQLLQTKWAFDAHAYAHIFCNLKDFFCKLKRPFDAHLLLVTTSFAI